MRSGEISLKPGGRSGWYDHQTWSLEPLLVPDRMPEAARLELGKRYRKHLEDLFRGALALARETHAKQAGGGRGGYGGATPASDLGPPRPDRRAAAQPLYARRAAGYRFVRSVLEEAFGADALDGMHRLTPEGASTAGLAEELATGSRGCSPGRRPRRAANWGWRCPAASDAAARCFSAWRADLRPTRTWAATPA